MKVSMFENLKNSKCIGESTISEILQQIKNGYTKKLVEEARGYGKGTAEYEQIKVQIQTFTPNARFYPSRKLSNLLDLSGFIYLDFDDSVEQFKITEVPFVYACWKSLSGKGYGALASITNLNKSNFTNTWLYLADFFKDKGLEVDSLTKDIPRQNVISYDPSIYINENAIPIDALRIKDFTSKNGDKTKKPTYEATSTVNQQLFESNITSCDYNFIQTTTNSSPIKYKTTLTDYSGLDYVVIEDGLPYRGCFLPKSIKDGARHKWLSSYIISLLYNNPSISLETINQITIKTNIEHCTPPMAIDKLMKLTKWLFNKSKEEGFDYQPYFKKIWFNPTSTLNIKDKRRIVGREVGALRRKKTLNRIQTAYDKLKVNNEIVTQKMIKEQSGLSIRTIKSRWKEIIK